MTIQPLLKSRLTSLTETDQLLCEKLIEANEGFNAFAYDDATGLRVKAPKGALTIGYGINIAIGISGEEAVTLLRGRLCQAEAAVMLAFPWYNSMSDIRKIALLDMAYNLGVPGLRSFNTFLTRMQEGQYSAAADDLQATLWHKQVGERAIRDDYMIRNNLWLNE